MHLERVFPEEIELIIFHYLRSNDILNYSKVMCESKSAKLLELYHNKVIKDIFLKGAIDCAHRYYPVCIISILPKVCPNCGNNSTSYYGCRWCNKCVCFRCTN